MKLTKTDKAILDSYVSMVDSLSAYLGTPYEISIHSLEDLRHSVIKICNGYHSGRSVGAPITDLALNMLKRVSDNDYSSIGEYSSYNALSAMGEKLKSSTIPIFGENHRLIGLVCINLYLELPASEFFASFISDRSEPVQKESFATSSAETVNLLIADIKKQVYADDSIHPSCKNKEIITLLYQQGIFKIKESVCHVSEALNISKNTVYMHLRNLKSTSDE